MKPFKLATLAALLLTGFAYAAPNNLVVNGSFETGRFDAWTTTLGDDTTFVDGSSTTGNHVDQATDGHWLAFFGSTQADGGASIAQQLATVAGTHYTLSLDLANTNGGSPAANAFAATIGGNALLSFDLLGDQDYIHYSASFTADSASTALTLSGFNDNGYLELDNVVVQAAAVPEPDTVLLDLAGLAALAAWRRVKRTRRHTPRV